MGTKMKKITGLFVSVTLLMSIISTVFADYKERFWDFPEDWSTEAVTAAVDNGLLHGYEGQIHANDYLTRAEMAAVVVRAFNAKTTADISIYSDVSPDAWYYESIAKAVKMEAINGVGNNLMAPTDNITRQEVFTMLARVLVLSSDNEEALERFPDSDEISDWAKPSIIAMAEKGYVNGDQNNYLHPRDYITRAEFAQYMYNTIKTYITEPGTYEEDLDGIVVLRVGDVTLKKLSVDTDLVVGDGVMKEKVYLDTVDVNGRLLTRGGEMTLKKTTVDEGVVVKNVNGIVHFNNYRDESVFKGINEITTATFLQRPTSSRFDDDFGSSGSTTVTYTVTFKDWDGTVLGTNVVAAGTNATAPANPTREGYDFIGWDVGFTNVTGDLTVTAQYQIKTYTVTFKDWDGTTLSTETVNHGSAATAPTPTREGYDFIGWDVDITNVTSGLTATAQYQIKTYTVTFKDWDGTTLSTETVNHGSAATAPADPTRAGYTFTGWDVDFSNVTGDLTVTATYVPEHVTTYTVTFKDWDGRIIVTRTVPEGSAATPPADPTRAGYTFTGWDVDFSNVTSDLTVTAQYIPVAAPLTYTVRFYRGYNYPEHIAGKDVVLTATPGTALYVPETQIPTYSDRYLAYDKQDIASLYRDPSYTEETRQYVIPEFWYFNDSTNELERFDETVEITKDTDVYLLYKEISFVADLNGSLFSGLPQVGLTARYDENSRLVQSGTALAVSMGGWLSRAQAYPKYDSIVNKFYSKLASTGYIDNNQNIKMVDIPIKIAKLITKASTEGMVREYLQMYEPANEDAIMNSPYFTTLINDVNNEALDTFDITADNIEEVKAFSKAVRYNLTYEDAMSFGSAGFVQQFANLIGEATVRVRFDDMKIEFSDSIDAMVAAVEAGAANDEHTTFLHIRVNPIDDVLVTIYDKAQNKVETTAKGNAKVDYNNNIYLKHLVEDDMIAALLNHSGTETDELTGYSLKEIMEYYEYALATAVILDDAVCYYDDKGLTNAEIENIYNIAYGKIVQANNKLTDLINKVETTLTDAPAAIEQVIDLAKKINDLMIEMREEVDDLINSNVDFSSSQIQNVQDILLGRENPTFNVDSLFAFYDAKEGAIKGKLQNLITSGQITRILNKIVSSPLGQYFDADAKNKVCEVLDNIATNGIEHYEDSAAINVTTPKAYKFTFAGNTIKIKVSYRY